MWKNMFGWLMYTMRLAISLPSFRLKRLDVVLDWFLQSKRCTSARWWHLLLGPLRSIMDVIPGGWSLFCHLQVALRAHTGHTPLAVHNDLENWRRLIVALHRCPTHMLEVVSPDPTTLSAHDNCGNGMGVIFREPDGILFVWRWNFAADIAAHLVSWDKPDGDHDINKFDLSGYYAQAALVTSHMTPLAASAFGCNNFTTVLWVKRSSIWRHSPALAFLCACDLLLRKGNHILGRVSFLPGKLNGMANTALRLCQLSNTDILTYFSCHFPQDKSWKICQPPPTMMQHIATVLRARKWHTVCRPPASTPTRLPGANGENSPPGWVSDPTLATLPTPSLSSKYLPTASEMAS